MKIQPILKSNTSIILMMIILVPVTGEFKFYPLQEPFRVSFGPTVFFFLLLFLKQNRIIFAGILTGISVDVFRMLMDLFMLHSYNFTNSFYIRLPACFYYITYALLFYFLKVRNYHNRIWLIGCLGIGIEIIAQLVELMVQYYSIGATVNIDTILQISIIAIFRSFFVVSFYSMIVLYEAKVREEEITNKNEHLLLLLSSLYEEAIHVKKTLKNTETITKETYELYRTLKKETLDSEKRVLLSHKALKIAGDIHDIKKDNQRIYAGLSKLIGSENFSEYTYLEHLFHIIVKSNEKYAQSLGKKIDFSIKIDGITEKYDVFILLSLLNNLVSNSIEAIRNEGKIALYAFERDGKIKEKYGEMVYKPGFSLKFDGVGTSSTGIGLSYNKEIVTSYGGEIYHQSSLDKGSRFTIELPKARLMKGVKA
jgi:two-component system sensor histidine kinase YcbA